MKFLTLLYQIADNEIPADLTCVSKMKTKVTLLFLSLIAVAFGLASAETKAKPSASHISSPAEKRLDGIPRPTDKDNNPSEPFHIARTPAEKALDEIIRRADKDKNIFEYVLGRPWYDAKKNTGYARLFTKKFVRAVTKKESDLVKKSCGGKYGDGICGIDYSPINCGQDYSESGYLYRTVEDDGHKAKILSLGVDFAPSEIQISYRLIKDGDDWKLDGVSCDGGGEFNVDCGSSLCAEDVPDLREKAGKGDVDAQYSLAVMYSISRGVKRDYAEMERWLRKAAEQGHVHAQYQLGSIYEDGRGVAQDYAEAERWLRKAAERGHAKARRELDKREIEKSDRR